MDLPTLIEHEIPEGRQNLEQSFSNLERVAAYCEANYIQAADKHAALDETRRFTIQSLASVAYQVNTLASNLLQMLDLQAAKIGDMGAEVNNISQIIDIHKEKVARREIGVLTATKSVVRQHKLVAPAQAEKPQRYVRRQIDYSILDDLGHSVRLQQPVARLVVRTGSTVSAGSSGSNGSAQPVMVPTQNYAAPGDVGQYGTGRYSSLSKASASKEYRTPVTIAPPTIPMQGAEYVTRQHPGLVQTNQSMAAQQRKPVNYQQPAAYVQGNYSAVNLDRSAAVANSVYYQPQQADASAYYFAATHNQAPFYGAYGGGANGEHTRFVGAYPSGLDASRYSADGAYVPANLSASANSSNLPPPPAEFDFIDDINNSPPLPPPPPVLSDFDQYAAQHRYSGGAQRRDANLPEWVPSNYLEKVVAVYDYQAEKADELSFQENAVIYVVKKNEDGWFEGVMDGVTGLFPGNYVEPCL